MNPESHDTLVIDLLTAPLSPEATPNMLAGDRTWERHPLTSKVVGFAAARVAVEQQIVHVKWYGLETGDEGSALDFALDVLSGDVTAFVCFGGAHHPLRMLEHRLIERGVVTPNTWDELRRVTIDVCDDVAMHGHHPRPSLEHAYDMYQLLAHPPESGHIGTEEGTDARSPEALAARLRARMDAIIALYGHLRVGPMASVAGSLVLQQTDSPPARLPIAC